jgi:hypothetical protein
MIGLCDHRWMDSFLGGFTNEMIKLGRRAVPVENKSLLSSQTKGRLSRAGQTAALTAALHAVLSGRDASLGDSVRAGAGWGGGMMAGRAGARAAGFGGRGKLIAGLIGGAAGYKALQKKSSAMPMVRQPKPVLKPQAGMVTSGGKVKAPKVRPVPKPTTLPPHQALAMHR